MYNYHFIDELCAGDVGYRNIPCHLHILIQEFAQRTDFIYDHCFPKK